MQQPLDLTQMKGLAEALAYTTSTIRCKLFSGAG